MTISQSQGVLLNQSNFTMSSLVLYPGSFDPVTKGHEDLIRRASAMFDRVVIGVAQNIHKTTTLFSTETRVALLKESVHLMALKNVTVSAFTGLTVHYAEAAGATCLLRGLRVVSDFEYECSMYQANATVNAKVDTIFMMPSLPYQFLSSRMVRELAFHQENLGHYVSPHVEEALRLAYPQQQEVTTS
jgi:pantetheine-phosphate adenylyltransferase